MTALRLVQLSDRSELGGDERHDDQLGNSLARLKFHGCRRVKVDQADTDLATITGVDDAGTVHDPETLTRRVSGTGRHHSYCARRKGETHPCADEYSLSRLQSDGLGDAQVGTRVPGSGITRQELSSPRHRNFAHPANLARLQPNRESRDNGILWKHRKDPAMAVEEKILWKIYAGALGAATTLLTQKLVTKAWETATGDVPPDPNDPDTPLTQALIWALCSGLGVGMAQLTMNRYMHRRWFSNTGRKSPGQLRTKMDL